MQGTHTCYSPAPNRQGTACSNRWYTTDHIVHNWQSNNLQHCHMLNQNSQHSSTGTHYHNKNVVPTLSLLPHFLTSSFPYYFLHIPLPPSHWAPIQPPAPTQPISTVPYTLMTPIPYPYHPGTPCGRPTSQLLQSSYATSKSARCAALYAECLHGFWQPWDNEKAATFFPQPIGLAAMWDTQFMEEVAGIISQEARAINNHQYKQDKTNR